MRILFPTGILAQQSKAAGHFNIDTRPIEPEKSPEGDWFPDMQTLPMQSFVDLSDGNKGFSILSDSLTEYEAVNDDQRTLAITLFRSVKNHICTEFRTYAKWRNQEGGQLLQKLNFHYAIFPHSGDWQKGWVQEVAAKFNTPTGVFQITPHKLGTWPQAQSLFSVEPEALMISCLKKAEDRNSLILRLSNATSEEINGNVKIFTEFNEAYRCNLNEERKEAIAIENGNETSLVVRKGEIATIEIVK
jgi:mannosylglycerate hydrolase